MVLLCKVAVEVLLNYIQADLLLLYVKIGMKIFHGTFDLCLFYLNVEG